MKRINPRLILAPTLITAACTAILVIVNNLTKPLIAAGENRHAVAAARLVLPEDFPEPVQTNLNGIACFASYGENGELRGVALEGATQTGYGGEIRVMVGFADNAVHTFVVLAADGETPGLGSKIKSDAFRLALSNRPVDANWRLKKDGGPLDAITAATISSRAALDAIRDAIGKYKTIMEPDGP